jgi:hypothetical protein
VIAAILVDTHLVLWARIAPERLTAGERRALDDARSCYVSAVSLWETAILMALDRILSEEKWMSLRGAHRATKQSRCGDPPPVRDCFAAPVLGRRIAPTRGLAMTGSNLAGN